MPMSDRVQAEVTRNLATCLLSSKGTDSRHRVSPIRAKSGKYQLATPRLGLRVWRERFHPSSTKRAAIFAWRAASRFPSPAEMIDPFINMCQAWANFSGSLRLASSAKPCTIARIFARWTLAALRTGLSTFDSNKTLMNEHPSNDLLWNH